MVVVTVFLPHRSSWRCPCAAVRCALGSLAPVLLRAEPSLPPCRRTCKSDVRNERKTCWDWYEWHMMVHWWLYEQCVSAVRGGIRRTQEEKISYWREQSVTLYLETFSCRLEMSPLHPCTSPCRYFPWDTRWDSVIVCSFTTASLADHSVFVLISSAWSVQLTIKMT